MSLTGLALAATTPLTPAQSVLLMGVLSIIYCTLGGIFGQSDPAAAARAYLAALEE